jgi:Zn-dependent protease
MMNLSPALLISRIVTLVIAFTFHEFYHAQTAVWLGDNTPRMDGRLTLNPLKHLDPWGSLLLLVAGFGWAKPVRVNPYAVTRKNKAGMMLVAAAGPCANLLLAIIGALILRSGVIRSNTPPLGLNWMPRPSYFLSQFIWTNISLLVFNLIPLAPLDGEKVAGYFIPESFRGTWQRIQAEGTKILMLCFFVLPYLGVNFMDNFVSTLSMGIYRMLLGG